MKLIEALEIANQHSSERLPNRAFLLACGFSPLHLRTFLLAHLQCRFPKDRVEIRTGLYGDLIGTVERADQEGLDSAAVMLEWADLDGRLSIRQLGGWQPSLFPDILKGVHQSLVRLEAAVVRFSAACPIGMSLPTLPLLPLDYSGGWQAGAFETKLHDELSSFAVRCFQNHKIRLLNPQRLDIVSPLTQRFDSKAELQTGFPYTVAHADQVSSLIATILQSPAPKKGIITDLDDTCWKGILGEVGADGICWDLGGHAQLHGLYQQYLRALGERGVLVGVASKNDPRLVETVLGRSDILLPPTRVFPIEANWGEKSESIRRILQTWNIASDDVVFVDDSPMELAEVKAAHPRIECLLFPKHDSGAVLALLERLRDLFGQPLLSEEDRIRQDSIRNSAVLHSAVRRGASTYEELLENAEASIQFVVATDPNHARAFELVNKTNQFNLNGRRYREQEWHAFFKEAGAFLVTVSYRDKFGPLGEIAVILGRNLPHRPLQIEAWVMSCRAFSRRIEFQCIKFLFDRFQAESLLFDWGRTPRNGPLCDFLNNFGELQSGFSLSRQVFDTVCPPLFHSVGDAVYA